MYYIVKMNEDFQTWNVLDKTSSEDDAYDLMETYSNKYPYASVDYFDQEEYDDYLQQLNKEVQHAVHH